MVAYRFCRTDDVELLVKALNECYFVHFPDSPGTSVDDFKRDIREIDLWCSSCMVGADDGGPIALVTGAKRTRETLIHRIGVRPDSIRRGHARHMLSSLGKKFSVLGPPRIVAEVPKDLPEACALFEACGYQPRRELADYSLASSSMSPDTGPPRKVQPDPSEVAYPITLDEVLEQGVFKREISRSWVRSLDSLQNLRDELQGLAIASEEQIEAYIFYRDLGPRSRREILSLAHADGAESATLLEILLRFVSSSTPLDVVISKISTEEVSAALLVRAGFQREREYVVWEASAQETNPG